MRTTLSLDDDVAVVLKKAQAASKKGFKTVVNEALRVGLKSLIMPPRRRKSYKTRPVSLGRCLIGGLDDIGGALELAEGDKLR